MPVVAEKREGNRRDTRRLLLGVGFFFALLLLLPVVPCFVPVALHVGDRWLVVEGAWVPPTRASATGGGRHFEFNPAAGMEVYYLQVATPRFTATGDYYGQSFQVSRFYYIVQCFRGHRGWP